MSPFLLTATWHFGRIRSSPPVVCLQPTDPGRHKKMWSSFLKLVFPCYSSAPSQVSLSIWQVGGTGFYKWRRDAAHPGNVDLWGHPTSLYLTAVSTLGNVHNTVGYSFPLLPHALQGGLQCGLGRGYDNSRHVYSGQIHTPRTPCFLWSEPQRADETLGILRRISGG